MPGILANVIENAFGPLITVFQAILVFIHDSIVGGSWGFAIIGLTIVVRAVLVPLTVKQFQSMAKLQALAPQMKALQARYKEDKQRLNEEMMKLYRENHVNPFGSCLPLLLQLPVFLSLFYMLRLDLKKHICGSALHMHGFVTNAAIQKHTCDSVAAHSAKFLFIPDLTAKTSGGVLITLIVLYVGSQLVSSLLMTVTADRNQRLMAIGLPFIFTIFIAQFPAGLIVYWITTNIWTVGQQYIIRHRMGIGQPAPAAGSGDQGQALDGKASARGDGTAGGGSKVPAVAQAAAGSGSSRGAPPPPPRKKKKRSGRRR